MTRRVLITSAGCRHGSLPDADLRIDCRPFSNPYHNRGLRVLNGLDERVKEEVLAVDDARQVLEAALLLITKRVAKTVLFYCTGGHHRSVVMAEELAVMVRVNTFEKVRVEHRDLERK